ncbi:MAG TPA: 2-oxoacid:ferredoxin oxidoreductase subunit beta [Candidatus Edwardsbacteria bacterium]|nr:2-oxoacid:ferredoxin oxidoreductase subunit beta [Candidatus Edwardsbacteria bacterium]
MLDVKLFDSTDEVAWCPGCYNFAILRAVKQALASLDIQPHQVMFSSGIGQAAKLPHYLKCNLFNGLHGRTLPVATGIKLANHALHVIAEGGDGDGYAEGGNHFVHAMRRNPGVTYLVHDNQIYGLTKGQTSPTSEPGFVTATTPFGNFNFPEHPLAVAVACDCSFVARGFAGDAERLAELIAQAISHPGFALVDILQPCVTFNKVNTYQWYKQRVYALDQTHDPRDRGAAFAKATEWGDRIPLGVIYRNDRPPLESLLPQLKHGALAAQDIGADRREDLIANFR